jgi:hypothetical protein
MATSKRDVVQHIREEDEDFYSDDDLFEISSWGADLSFRELIARYESDELIKPEFQRKYVWDKTDASRFIDSLLLGLPVPSIFLAKTASEKMLIVDGYQRIMTVTDFVQGIFTGDGKVFKLANSEKINARWRGKAFSELGDIEQRRVRNTTIHAIIFVQKQPEDTNTSLYQVFERINSSGRALIPQEIRNCIYQGRFNDLLTRLNSYAPWRKLYGSDEPDARMRDIEFILRFFALRSDFFGQQTAERISLKKFLNQYMGMKRGLSTEEAEAFEGKFKAAIDLLFRLFGEFAFHNVSPTTADRLVPKFSPTIYDSLMLAADHALAGRQFREPANPEATRRALLNDPDYRTAITVATMRIDSIRARFTKASAAIFGI